MDLDFQPLSRLSINEMMEIEEQAHSHPWSRAVMQTNFGSFYCNRGLYVGPRLVGYFIVRVIAGEAELINLCVRPDSQGHGYGSLLMKALIMLLPALEAERVTLEVRRSNQVAQLLYKKFGFKEIDFRTDYYPTDTGREDALIMQYCREDKA